MALGLAGWIAANVSAAALKMALRMVVAGGSIGLQMDLLEAGGFLY